MTKISMDVLVLKSSFMKGRRPKISGEMWLTHQNGLGLILKLAQLVEENIIAVKALKEPPGLKLNLPNPCGASEVILNVPDLVVKHWP